MGSLGCALEVVWFVHGFIGMHPEVVWFIRGCWGAPWVYPGPLGSFGCALAIVGFIQGSLVHWGARCSSTGLSGVAGFIGVRPGGGRDHPGSLVVASIRVRLLGRRVHLGSLLCALGVVGVIQGLWVYWGAPRRVNLGSLVSTECALVVAGFVQSSWVH